MLSDMQKRYLKRPVADETSVEYLTEQGLSRGVAEVLCSRGVNRDNYAAFIEDAPIWHSPFEMANMDSAVEIINYVMESDGRVLIYGDYDADGLTASSILSLFFSDNGVENDVVIPTRDEGYGLHAENVLRAFQNNYYDLVITVDCGISNAEDVNKIMSELGVEVIVTDHHELPETLPDCICVNPKLGYPFPYLAGAGVAWKLVEALAGREVAAKYSLLACIGTIGDIMPMRDENRAIVKLGLSNFQHKSLQKLAELSNCGTLNATEISMRLTPKINAAGRMGSPLAALSVLLGRDKADMGKINLLLELNEKRKQLTEEIVSQCDAICDGNRIARERMVFLYGDSWQHGLLGIVASRYKEKYKLPAVVMTLDGENYVGSARSIENINLFEVFSQCKEYLVKFGGHKASVGFSVAKDKVELLRRALSQVLGAMDEQHFETRLCYDIDLGVDCTAKEVLALSEKLQPLLPQDKILCRVADSVSFANTFGRDEAHLSATLACGLEVKGFFKFGKFAPFIRNGANVELICSLDTDSYTHNICGTIEDISLVNSVCFDDFYKQNLIKNFVADKRDFAEKDIAPILEKQRVAVVFDDYETYLAYCEKFDLSEWCVDIFFDSGLFKTVVVSPVEGYDFSRFDDVVYFAKKGMCRVLPNATYVEVRPAREDLYNLQLSRDICTIVFSALRKKNDFDNLTSVYEKYLTGKVSFLQYIAALRVFCELELIKISDSYNVELNTSQKKDLTNSSIFRAFQ